MKALRMSQIVVKGGYFQITARFWIRQLGQQHYGRGVCLRCAPHHTAAARSLRHGETAYTGNNRFQFPKTFAIPALAGRYLYRC